jgi:hypothetical protein
VSEHEPGPRELLARAIQSLDQADRERVTAWLLDRTFGTPHTGSPFGVATAMARGHVAQTDLFAQPLPGSRRGEHQVVPIRLPTEQHAALREWCSEHGFTMATVVRGLVERFLEERGQLPGRATA